MKRISILKGVVGSLGISMLFGMASCTDDHFDIRVSDPAATGTIWQRIEAEPELSDFAEILKNIKVYRKEGDKSASITYAELLNSSQSFTVWAPLNGTFDKEAYMRRIAEIQETQDPEEAAKLEYNLGVQFPQNHIARFNFESSADQQDIRMMNSKLSAYDASAGEFNGVELCSEFAALPSSNGTIHCLQGESPFAYNIYDYIQANPTLFSTLYKKLNEAEVKTFSPGMSVEGGLDNDGNMVYLDSVYYTTNELIDYSGAQVKNEDSMYVAVIPTDAAWNQGFEKLSKYYNYGSSYSYNYTGSNGKFFNMKRSLNEPALNYPTVRDSIVDYTVTRRLLLNMYFAPYRFAPGLNRSDFDGLVAKAMAADTLTSTNGTQFINLQAFSPHPLFGTVEPQKASNGIIFPITEYNMDPSYSYQTRQELDLSSDYYVSPSTSLQNGTKGSVVYLVKGTNWDESIDLSDLEYKRYRFFQAKASGAMNAYIPLRNLLSGKYKISIQILPNRVSYDQKWYTTDKETGEQTEKVEQNIKFDASLIDDEGKTIGKKVTKIEVSDEEVQTIVLFESIEIPKCYANLPYGLDSFPHLVLAIPSLTSYRPVKNVDYGLSVAKVIIEPVHE